MNLHCQIKVDARGAAPPPSSRDMLEAAKEQLGIYGGMGRNTHENEQGYALISFDPDTVQVLPAESRSLEIFEFARKQCREPYHHWTVTFSGVDE